MGDSVFQDNKYEHEMIARVIKAALKPGMKGQKAAKAVYEALKPVVLLAGQNPAIELMLRGPADHHYAGKCWLVGWEAGPYEWAIRASFVCCNASGQLCEPYYSFDLCFYDNE
jgi:hypothetical protein